MPLHLLTSNPLPFLTNWARTHNSTTHFARHRPIEHLLRHTLGRPDKIRLVQTPRQAELYSEKNEDHDRTLLIVNQCPPFEGEIGPEGQLIIQSDGGGVYGYSDDDESDGDSSDGDGGGGGAGGGGRGESKSDTSKRPKRKEKESPNQEMTELSACFHSALTVTEKGDPRQSDTTGHGIIMARDGKKDEVFVCPTTGPETGAVPDGLGKEQYVMGGPGVYYPLIGSPLFFLNTPNYGQRTGEPRRGGQQRANAEWKVHFAANQETAVGRNGTFEKRLGIKLLRNVEKGKEILVEYIQKAKSGGSGKSSSGGRGRGRGRGRGSGGGNRNSRGGGGGGGGGGSSSRKSSDSCILPHRMMGAAANLIQVLVQDENRE